MKRKVKEIQDKSRLHTVLDMGRNRYTVISGTSGEKYQVYVNPNNAVIKCTCKFGITNKGRICSHKNAILNFRAEQQGYRVMIWANTEDALRQHRREGMVQDVSWTVRKVDTVIQPSQEVEAKEQKVTSPLVFAMQFWWQDRQPQDVLDPVMLHGTKNENYAQKGWKVAKKDSGWSFVESTGTFDQVRNYMEQESLMVGKVDTVGYRWNGRKEFLYNISVVSV